MPVGSYLWIVDKDFNVENGGNRFHQREQSCVASFGIAHVSIHEVACYRLPERDADGGSVDR